MFNSPSENLNVFVRYHHLEIRVEFRYAGSWSYGVQRFDGVAHLPMGTHSE